MQFLSQPSLLTREDTMLGVCQGLGEDLGISPNLFRIAFAAALFFNPLAALGTYAVLGLVVLGTRLLFPAPARPIVETAEAEEVAPVPAQSNDTAEALPVAA